jgi:hypothetical protein
LASRWEDSSKDGKKVRPALKNLLAKEDLKEILIILPDPRSSSCSQGISGCSLLAQLTAEPGRAILSNCEANDRIVREQIFAVGLVLATLPQKGLTRILD